MLMKSNRRWSIGVLTAAVFAFASSSGASAQDKKPSEKHDATVLNKTLKDVIDAGAKIFNDHGDHAGCYRMWQGSLMSIRPFVPPDMQKSIDEGLACAAKLDTYADRAFELRRVLDDIRTKAKADDGKKDEVKEKKEEKKKKKKDDESTPAKGKGEVAGKLTFNGKPVAGGYFVTLVAADSKKYSTAIQKDGTFQFKTPIPAGDYRIAIERIPDEKLKGAPLPARYSSAENSGLAISVKSGKQQIDLNLVK